MNETIWWEDYGAPGRIYKGMRADMDWMNDFCGCDCKEIPADMAVNMIGQVVFPQHPEMGVYSFKDFSKDA